MVPWKKILISGLIAIGTISFIVLNLDYLVTRLFSSRRNGFSNLIYFIFVTPGIITGNGNIHNPVWNYGGFAAANFVIIFTISFSCLLIPGLFKNKEEILYPIKRIIFIVRTAICGSIVCAIVMLISAWIGFIFMLREDASMIISKTKAILAAMIIGLIYGAISGFLIGIIMAYKRKTIRKATAVQNSVTSQNRY
jgi:hypothetical protein